MRYRAVFLDVDGTLIRRDGRVAPAVATAVREAAARGVAVVLCTGRSRRSTLHIARQTGALGPAVLSNGGLIADLATGEVLAHYPLPIPLASQSIRAMLSAGIPPLVYQDGEPDDDEAARLLYDPACPPGPHHFELAIDRLTPVPDLADRLPYAPIAVGAAGDERLLRPLADLLRRELGEAASVTESSSEEYDAYYTEVYAAEARKERGMALVCDRLGIPLAETVAVGDHLNDLGMLCQAGVGVAMGNAEPELLAIADWIAPGVDEDGVAAALARFFPGEA